MTEAVLDAFVVLKWFHTAGENSPSLRRRCCTWRSLTEVARALDALNFELREPELDNIAEWTARGLTAYDASYVALAESEAINSLRTTN